MKNRFALKLFGFIAPLVTWILNALIPGRRASVLAAECRNKCRIMGLVQSLEGYVDAGGQTPLETIVEKCYSLGPFPALWAVEGAGKDIGEWNIARNPDVTGILTDPPLKRERHGALLMLHAGMGLGFAKHHVERLKSGASDDDVRRAVVKIVELCRNNSRQGYYGAAIESLGLVSRFLQSAAFCRRVHEVLADRAPDSVSFFWRGVGRCLYFHPLNFMPGFERPSRAFAMAEAEAPTPELKQGLLSGMAWALTLVNMSDPRVMEYVLEHDDEYFEGNPGFLNGVISSVVMRYDTTPDDPLIWSFARRRPDNPRVAELWRTRIADSFDTAIRRIHPALKKANRLDEVFRYQPIEDLAAGLEGQAASPTRV